MSVEASKPRVAVFFTWDVSLALWEEKGLLSREIRLYEELVQRGVTPVLLSWGGTEDLDVAARLPKGMEAVSLYTKGPRPKNKALRGLCSLLVPWMFRDVLRGCNLYKTNQIWGGWVAALSALIFKRPLIARCGFELYDFTIRQGHGALRRAFVWGISWVTYKAASRICVATREDKSFIAEKFRVSEKKISIHPNWIDTDVFTPQVREEKAGHILFVGRLNAQKNLEALIEAVAGTAWVLDIAGDGELKDSLQRLAQNSGAEVNFLGFQPNDRLPDLYNSSPVFVLPSHYEGNPKTLLEAMACGRAVLGTRVHGIQSVIEEGRTGLLCGQDSASIRSALERLMEDKALRENLGQAARVQIEGNQTLSALVEKEQALYAALLRKEKL